MSVCVNCFLTPCSCEAGGILPAGVVSKPVPNVVGAVARSHNGREARIVDVFRVAERAPERDMFAASPWMRRWWRHFDQAPNLVQVIREATVPLRATRFDAVIVDTSKGAAPAPANLAAVDDANDVWAALVPFVIECASILGIAPPQATGAAWAHHGEVAGFPAQTTPKQAYRAVWDVTTWLDRWATELEYRIPAEPVEHVHRVIRRHAARWTPDGEPVRQRRRFCGVCGERGVIVIDDGDYTAIRCVNCAADYPFSDDCAAGRHHECGVDAAGHDGAVECGCACHHNNEGGAS